MTPEQNQRSDEVWARIIGLFGGDSVKRKYGASMPAEWRGIIGILNAVQLDRGMRRLVHSGRDQVPSLPAFVKLCRTIGDDSIDEGPQAPALPNPDAWVGDQWDIAANRHLQAHIAGRIHANPRHYGHPAPSHAMRKLWRDESLSADASPEFIAAIRRLVTAKNAWAEDMRDLAANHPQGIVDPAVQRACWSDYLGAAEREVRAA